MSTELELKPEDRLLFIINDNMIYGSTRFQKYGFLLFKQYEKELKELGIAFSNFNFYADWKAHYYGPYSKELEKDIENTISSKLLIKSEHKVDGSEKIAHIYSLTLRGRARWRKLFNKVPEEIIEINKKIQNLQNKNFYTLLKEIYDVYPEYTTKSIIKDDLNNL